MPKTATTWLQDSVFKTLKNTACIGRPFHGTQDYKDLKAALTEEENDDVAKDIITRLVKKMAGSKSQVLLSDETLYYFPLQTLLAQRIKACGFELEVLVTTRNPESAVLSYYHGAGNFLKFVPKPYPDSFVSFDNFFEFNFQSKFHNKMACFDLERAVAGYRKHAKSLHIFPYEVLKKDSSKYLSDLSAVLGEDLSVSDQAPQNASDKKGRRLRYRFLNFLTAGRFLRAELSISQRAVLKDRYGEYDPNIRTIDFDPT